MNEDEKYMQRCLDLALNGKGNTYPNPLVGSVIVYKNKIIGEGYHTKAGKNHAEINAIKNVRNKNLLKKSTLYVNLEPCSHFGKTPPCSKKIAESGIHRVVIGTIDSTDKVSGKGIKIMKQAGIKVKVGVLEQKSREINKRFFVFNEKKRPYLILKWAETIDGYIDIIRKENITNRPTWISGKIERALVHKWRTTEQAIMIGTNTAKMDNPYLSARNWSGQNPIRIVIDKNLQLVKNLNLFNNQTKTLVFNYKSEKPHSENIYLIKLSSKKDILEQIFSYLYKLDIQSVIIEGGRFLLQSLIDKGLWDECRIFKGNAFFYDGIKAPVLKNYQFIKTQKFNKSQLYFLKNKQNKF